jgi:hypothetical protein
MVQDRDLSSPFFLIWNKNRDLQFCISYGNLNVTMKDCFLLPRTDNTMDMLTGAEWFPTPDLKCSYWQVAVHSQAVGPNNASD